MLFEHFSPVEILAIEKTVGTKPNRVLVEPGDHQINVALQLKGELKVGEDHPAKQAQSVPWQRIALLALSRLNEATSETCLREAFDGTVETPAGILDRAKAIADELLEATEITRKGVVRAELVATAMVGEGLIARPPMKLVRTPKRRTRRVA